MRRYGDTSHTTTIPGQNVGLKLTLQPVAEATPCQPTPNGLLWFSDLSGDFTEIAEAAHLGATDAASPILAVAKVLGETCGDVNWTVNWTPNSGVGGDPAIKTDGAELYVYQKTGSAPGELRVSAQCAGQTLGPIVLTLLQSAGGSCCADPQIDEMSRYRFGDSDVTIFVIGMFGLIDNSFNFGEHDVVFSGTAPTDYQLIASFRSLVLAVRGGDDTTKFTVSADVRWQCNDTDQSRTLTWPRTNLIWGD